MEPHKVSEEVLHSPCDHVGPTRSPGYLHAVSDLWEVVVVVGCVCTTEQDTQTPSDYRVESDDFVCVSSDPECVVFS